VCELDLGGLEDFVTVLSGTTDNVALLDGLRARVGDEPEVWLPLLLAEIRERKAKLPRSVP
jgi:type IV secretion system protein VirB4